MPGRRRDHLPVDQALCRRCQVADPTTTVRTEPLCTACFIRFVSTKVVKRMESFRVRHADPNAQRNLLVPVSFGPCSLALLHTLDEHLSGQIQKTGRTGYSLHILHVDIEDDPSASNNVERLKRSYPRHTYSTASLLDEQLLKDPSIVHLFPQTLSPHGSTSLTDLLSNLPTPTSRTDILQILLHKRIAHFATQANCEAILWSHTTTRLAEATISETAKGRGFSLPHITSPSTGKSSISSYFPLGDLFRKEIIAFCQQTTPPLEDLVSEAENMAASQKKPSTSTKHTTIDELMRQYFESVEAEYPSIVANVVKTTGKLKAREDVETRCELCEMPLEILKTAPERSRLCYGCIRTLGRDPVAEGV